MSSATTATIDAASHQMPEIMRVMDEIAFFTNIIALQAAVGAAETTDAGSPKHLQAVKPDGNAGR
jgi:methyl-accepting chemotaxis protein